MTLISHSHRFIFLHIWKTGGTSIVSALKQFSDSNDSLTLPGEDGQTLPNSITKHMTARALKEVLSHETFNNYFKFLFVRNPWDVQISYYYYALQNLAHFDHEHIRRFSSFEQYIEWRVAEALTLQKEFVIDRDGNKIVDHIGRYERLEADFAQICYILNLGIVTLPKINVSRHKNYRCYYNEKTRRLISDAYKDDIEFFEYRF